MHASDEFTLPSPPGEFSTTRLRRLKNLREINRGGSECGIDVDTPGGSTSVAILPAILRSTRTNETTNRHPSDQMVIHDTKSRAEWIANCENIRRR